MTQKQSYLQGKMAQTRNYCNLQIVFVDIVSYSRRRSYAQANVIHAFMQSIENALSNTAERFADFMQEIDAQMRPNIIVSPSGDGAAIAFPFEGADVMHLCFAEELLKIIDQANKTFNCPNFREQGWCDDHNGFLLRCGISEGKSILYKDLNNSFNIAGNPVNMAARVMDLADASQIFLTQEAYKQIIDYVPCMETRFRKYQQASIKHGLRIDVYQYIDDRVEGLDVSIRGSLGLTDRSIVPDDEVTSVVTNSEQNPVNNSEARGTEPIVSTSTDVVKSLRDSMIQIPQGEFSMGNDNIGRALVEIGQPFLICQHQITQKAYQEVMGRNPSRFLGELLPIDSVSWIDAITFCNRLSELSGLEPAYQVSGKTATVDFKKSGYRLPTEAEWEYCCRGGMQRERYGPIDKIAWFNGNASGQTHPVGEMLKNPFDLHDMLGNVWEWCNDWYQRRYPGDRQTNYIGPDSGFERILRGGSWRDLPDCARASFRHRENALVRESTNGFRIALPIRK